MNIITGQVLKFIRRKIYPLLSHHAELPPLQFENDIYRSQTIIAEKINENRPCMIARFGSNELDLIVNWIGVNTTPHSPWRYMKGEIPEWWWNKKILERMQKNAGFFPLTQESIDRFAKMMIEDAKQVDILGSWMKEEYYLRNELCNAVKVKLSHLEPPYLYHDLSLPSWSLQLKGKKVLVIHPFSETIMKQYERREKLFKRDDILVDFDLTTLKAVQSIGGHSEYSNWFDALDSMKNKMDHLDYDICIIGCGAYGFPLAAHAKRTGHKAIHLGGATQLLFGIRGKRWEERTDYQPLFNEYWVRPDSKETPLAASQVENGCYW